ncbi:MAG: hypothetical protein J5I98_00305 [Phaeodactylibacter sp.]|nr:hypothetical protein [Phaeodactylibacter sp.]
MSLERSHQVICGFYGHTKGSGWVDYLQAGDFSQLCKSLVKAKLFLANNDYDIHEPMADFHLRDKIQISL